MMNAVEIVEPGGPEVLQLVRYPKPELREGHIRIRVEAAGVNRPDVVQRLGRYPVPADASPLPGLEVAGRVEALGVGVTDIAIGDPVIALTHGGGYAEYVVARADHCLPWPKSLSAAEAACLPEVAFTVEFNMMMRAGLKAGETVLIHGGSSGIGSYAVQRAKAAGAKVVVTGGSQEKCAFARDLGADLAIEYRGDWKAEIVEALGENAVNVVLDMVAGSYVGLNLSLMARDGRYALISLLSGPEAQVPMNQILRKSLTLVGSTLRPQSDITKAEIAAEVGAKALPFIDGGKIRSTVFETFALADAGKAHALMESGKHMGKIALLVTEPK